MAVITNKPIMKLTPTRSSMSLLPFQKFRSYNPMAVMITHMTTANTNALKMKRSKGDTILP